MTIAPSVCADESTIWPGSGVVATSTSSSPVVISATRGALHDRQLDEPERREQAELARAEPRAGGDRDLAGRDVLAGAPHVVADRRGRQRDVVAVDLRVLLDHDGVERRPASARR